ncbi:MAG: hypothetical protein UU77_C0061G0004 [candidate division WWE3 bacterium GW2011_GWC1_41_7]|uniref:Uncharacterized protein n=1 Tax=candidate division WWE3 bacterium GW2011_GWC1_41_7 TaxID=1619119 RepID=A0A0G1A0U3_UNCKA|nr:MAG: hypothetical protein UU77_C0061G0004 [candidate division WWE3 bacterium GW2011_GWC1_41_7]
MMWFSVLSIVVVFLGLGVLIVMGLKDEVSKLLDVFLEGSFTVFDFINFLKEVYQLFLVKLRELLIFIAPVFAYIIGISTYFLLLYLYKLVGKHYDVTFLTIFLTITLVTLVGILNTQGQNPEKISWVSDFRKKMKSSFSDAIEVVIFVFFLTMDSTILFYVPEDLNVPLQAEIFGFDLMKKGFSLDHSNITIILISVAVMTEIMRNVLRVVYNAKKYYGELDVHEFTVLQENQRKQKKLKEAIRTSFNESKDEFVKFITFTTVLLSVFMFFPRLKLMSMMVASMTALVIDFAIPYRLGAQKGEDLINRILTKVFRL